jgi:hypothetical protein
MAGGIVNGAGVEAAAVSLIAQPYDVELLSQRSVGQPRVEAMIAQRCLGPAGARGVTVHIVGIPYPIPAGG